MTAKNKGLKNECQLITYPDSLGKNIQEMHYVMKRYFSSALGGVHILPFYPSSADRGFSPLRYDIVDETFGTWEDVQMVGEDFDLVVDFMLNHISRKSKFFQDFLEKGDKSEFADMFIRFKKLAENEEVSEEDLAKVYTRKPRPPYLEIEFPDATKEKIWCTFDYEQIDLDIKSPLARDIIRGFLIYMARRKTKLIRLDAFAYVTKKLGTNCFFLEPEIWEILNWVKDFLEPFDVQILPEVHEHYSYQLKIAEHGFYAYDFALPMLVLQALYDGQSHNLKNWLKICPYNQVTTLDTHDGIGVVDVIDLMTPEEIDRTKENLFTKGANVKKRYNTPDYNNLDIYQLNCTYYSALGDNDQSYLLARAIQFFTPGIPQVYYVGLLAGKNDIENLEKTKVGRNINRHNYTLDEIDQEVKRPVVQKLIKLMEFRNSHSAFNGKHNVQDSSENTLIITWQNPQENTEVKLEANLESKEFTVYSHNINTGNWEIINLHNN